MFDEIVSMADKWIEDISRINRKVGHKDYHAQRLRDLQALREIAALMAEAYDNHSKGRFHGELFVEDMKDLEQVLRYLWRVKNERNTN